MTAVMEPPEQVSAPAAGAEGEPFEPLILGFTCNWCSYRAADLAGTARTKYPHNVRLIRLMCSGRMEPEFILEGFARGADAVIMTGCWPEDCHYRIQSVKALRRFLFLRRTLADLGIEPTRLQRFYASAAEGQRFADEMARIVTEVKALGPIPAEQRAALGGEDGAHHAAVPPEPLPEPLAEEEPAPEPAAAQGEAEPVEVEG
jgi:F420-non-reducing hydrogenase iron-sulfur subunit